MCLNALSKIQLVVLAKCAASPNAELVLCTTWTPLSQLLATILHKLTRDLALQSTTTVLMNNSSRASTNASHTETSANAEVKCREDVLVP